MGTFTKTQSVLDNQYSYVNASLAISGNYYVDATTSTFKSVSGSVFAMDSEGIQGEFIGSFNGSISGEKMIYSFSQMTKEDYDLVWEAIKEIEPHVIEGNDNV